jgi:hypothetical protein
MPSRYFTESELNQARLRIMRLQQFSTVIVLLLFLPCFVVGCRTTGRSPFAFGAKANPDQVQSAAVAQSAIAVTPSAQAANDAVSQKIAAESRALSSSLPVASEAELAKYAAAGEANGYNTSAERPSSTRSGSFDSGSSSRSSGCSSGCCH